MGISTLIGEMIIGEVGKIGARDEEEVRVSVSIWGGAIVEIEGMSNWGNENMGMLR